MKNILMIIFLAIFSGACGAVNSAPDSTKTETEKLEIKLDGKDLNFEIKSGGVYYGNIINTAKDKSQIQTFAHTIYLANYEMDTTSARTMKNALTGSEQIRVSFQLTGEEGTKTDSPFNVGVYKVKADKINKVRSVEITTFVDGKEKEDSIDTFSGASKADGEIKITSVTAETVAGEINLFEDGKSVKGKFTAKLPVAKK